MSGSRGPLTNPNSRRSLAKAKRAALQLPSQPTPTPAIPAPAPVQPITSSTYIVRAPQPIRPPSVDGPVCPDNFSASQADLFEQIVSDLADAGVKLKRADGHAVSMCVRYLSAIQTADTILADPAATYDQRIAALRLQSAQGKDLLSWMNSLCCNPTARARIGINPQATERKPGILANLLAAKQARQNVQ